MCEDLRPIPMDPQRNSASRDGPNTPRSLIWIQFLKKSMLKERTARHPCQGAVQANPSYLEDASRPIGRPDTLDSKTYRTPLAHHRTPDTLAQGNGRPLVARLL